MNQDQDIEAPPSPKKQISNVIVCSRFRPLNSKERNDLCVCRIDDETFVFKDEKEEESTFSFDKVFYEDSLQADVYEFIALPIVRDAVNGVNGTIITYGQTGAGKTYSMEGPNVLESDDMKKGLLPRVVDGLFEHLASAGDSIKYKITLSMVEIYMEKVRAKHIKTSPRTTTPEIPDPIVEPQAIWSLSWLKLHWVEIVLGLLSFGISVAILVLTYLGFHENRTHSHLIGLAFLPAGVTFVHFILSSIYVYCGKEWKKEKIAFLAQAWYSKTVFQLLGFVFGGFTNELIAKVKLPAVLMFLYSFYAMCSSQYTKFPFSLDVTSTWLSSTAIVAFDTSRSSKKFWYPWGLIIGLVGIMVVRNICDRPVPNEDVVEDPDVEEPLIG